jgi:hypothetical protein
MRLMSSFFINRFSVERSREIFMRFLQAERREKNCADKEKLFHWEKSFPLIKCQMNYNIEESGREAKKKRNGEEIFHFSLLSALTFN